MRKFLLFIVGCGVGVVLVSVVFGGGRIDDWKEYLAILLIAFLFEYAVVFSAKKFRTGFGKRKRELEAAAKSTANNLLEGAILEDRRRRGVTNEETLSSEEQGSALASWAATARLRWQEAKRGDPDALRQTARNYLFGTGMPVKPCKARLWLAAARLIEIGPGMTQPSVDPFWEAMEKEVNEMLTGKEHAQAMEDAALWVKGLR